MSVITDCASPPCRSFLIFLRQRRRGWRRWWRITPKATDRRTSCPDYAYKYGSTTVARREHGKALVYDLAHINHLPSGNGPRMWIPETGTHDVWNWALD